MKRGSFGGWLKGHGPGHTQCTQLHIYIIYVHIASSSAFLKIIVSALFSIYSNESDNFLVFYMLNDIIIIYRKINCDRISCIFI